MKDLTIVIPFRAASERRMQIMDWICNRYRILFPESNIVVSDSDKDKPFSRAQSRNHGVDMVDTEYLLLADADTIPFRPFIELGVKALQEGANWVVPYGTRGFYVLKKPFSDKLLSGPPDAFVTPDTFEWLHQTESWGGLILMRTESFYEVNGYDERFQGWGYEDNAFQRAMDTIIGEFTRIESGWSAHLWHEAPMEETWEHPQIKVNIDRLSHYVEAVGNREQMLSVVSGNRI